METSPQAAGDYAAEMENHVKDIYRPFTAEQISAQMVRMLRSKGIQSEIELVFQSLEGLHEACPQYPGDWYFSGDYPTPGGTRLVNQAYIDWYEEQMNK